MNFHHGTDWCTIHVEHEMSFSPNVFWPSGQKRKVISRVTQTWQLAILAFIIHQWTITRKSGVKVVDKQSVGHSFWALSGNWCSRRKNLPFDGLLALGKSVITRVFPSIFWHIPPVLTKHQYTPFSGIRLPSGEFDRYWADLDHRLSR